MKSLTEKLPQGRSLATLVSIVLHGAVIAGVIYASITHRQQLPPPQQAIDVSLVAPQVQPELASKSVPAAPEQTATPVTESARHEVEEPPLPKEVAIPKPKPEPVKKVPTKPLQPAKPKPKAGQKHLEKQPERKVEPVTKPETKANPFEQNNTQQQTKAQTAPQKSTQHNQSVSQGKPQPLSRVNPAYPSRALALHVEGKVRVRFDIDHSGEVGNIEIIDAEPRGMFDSEVRRALKRWRYPPGQPVTGQTLSIIFRFEGGASVE